MSKTSTSDLLSVVIERDLEENPDDSNAWVVVRASTFPMPDILCAGYVHEPNCFCYNESAARLCDIGWLEEFVRQVGAKALLPDESMEPRTKLLLTGRMVSEQTGGLDGVDYDEYFDIENIEDK